MGDQGHGHGWLRGFLLEDVLPGRLQRRTFCSSHRGGIREETPGGQRFVPGDASLQPVQPVGVSNLPPEPWTGQRGEGPWAGAEGSAEKTK